MKRTLAQALAGLVGARERCIKTGSTLWASRHEDKIKSLIDENLPHGSGLDGEYELDLLESSQDELVINGEYHPMDEHGMYIGWIIFQIVVTPSLQFGAKIDIEFQDANEVDEYNVDDLGDYLADIFATALLKED